MNITLDLIKNLRDLTGVSITACKKALVEANGDLDLAVQVLRKKGESKMSERADRATGEGTVAYAQNENNVAILLLACETDFVAKSDEFVEVANNFAKTLLENGLEFDFNSLLSELSAKMGEKIEIKDKYILEGDNLGIYVHSNKKLGAVCVLNGGSQEVAFDVAMHITATNPLYLNPEEVPQELLDKEKVIWDDEIEKSGKPQEIWGKILEGKTKKFREENALLTQAFVKSPDISVAKYLSNNGSEIKQFVSLKI